MRRMLTRARSTGAPRSDRRDGGDAFVPDTIGRHQALATDDAEAWAEEFVASALNGESVGESARDEVVDDEEGGPFIVLDGDARLPTVPEEREPEREGHEPVSQQHVLRGARWAARGV
jgi:hypothetical protein